MLRVFSQGFFLYPYKSSGGDVGMPFIGIPKAPGHITAVSVINPVAARQGRRAAKAGSRTEDVVTEFITERTPITLTGFDGNAKTLAPQDARATRKKLLNGAPPNPRDAESWDNFDLIPEVDVFLDRVQLRSGWKDLLLSYMDCIGDGKICASPDKDTLKYKWRWKSGHRQAVSALGKYVITDFARGRIKVGKLDEELDGKSVIVLLNVADKEREDDFDRYMRGIDHHVAILRLCEPEIAIVVQNPLDNEPMEATGVTATTDYRTFVQPALARIRGRSKAVEAAPAIEKGYPSCASRRIRL
jgi:hypothetical protein